MRLVDQHVPTSYRSLGLNPDLRSLLATQAKHLAAIYTTAPPGQAKLKGLCLLFYELDLYVGIL